MSVSSVPITILHESYYAMDATGVFRLPVSSVDCAGSMAEALTLATAILDEQAESMVAIVSGVPFTIAGCGKPECHPADDGYTVHIPVTVHLCVPTADLDEDREAAAIFFRDLLAMDGGAFKVMFPGIHPLPATWLPAPAAIA
jgi:hypothetical protein